MFIVIDGHAAKKRALLNPRINFFLKKIQTSTSIVQCEPNASHTTASLFICFQYLIYDNRLFTFRNSCPILLRNRNHLLN